jgi:hypothetical protein
VEQLPDGATRYRPRTEGLFARIVRHGRDDRGDGSPPAASDYWEVTGNDGVTGRLAAVHRQRRGQRRGPRATRDEDQQVKRLSSHEHIGCLAGDLEPICVDVHAPPSRSNGDRHRDSALCKRKTGRPEEASAGALWSAFGQGYRDGRAAGAQPRA